MKNSVEIFYFTSIFFLLLYFTFSFFNLLPTYFYKYGRYHPRFKIGMRKSTEAH